MQKYLSSSTIKWLAGGLILAAVVLATYLIRSGNHAAVQQTMDAGTGYQEGVHFLTVDPPIAANVIQSGATPETEKITVTEFFWYGCPHCRFFEPLVEEWQSTFTDDLAFEQVPVVWNDLTRLHAAIYYLGLQSDEPSDLHRVLFDQIIELRGERDGDVQMQLLADVLGKNGFDATAVENQLNSPLIQQQVERANQLMRGAQVGSTPSLLIDYRWLILNDDETSEAGIFNVANWLIARAREGGL